MTGSWGYSKRIVIIASTGQIVSEVGAHFNNVAVFPWRWPTRASGLVVAGILLSRGLCAVLADHALTITSCPPHLFPPGAVLPRKCAQ